MRIHKLLKLLEQQDLALILDLAYNALMADKQARLKAQKKAREGLDYSSQDSRLAKHMGSFNGGWGQPRKKLDELMEKLDPIVELCTCSEEFSYRRLEDE